MHDSIVILKEEAATIPERARLLSLQIGVNWFSGGSGGLDRFYQNLIPSLPAAGVDVCGLVSGPGNAEALSAGRVRSFGSASGGLPRKLVAARKAIGAAIRVERPHLVAAHFAVFIAPALDRLGGIPFVMHFHGPWAEESRQEGEAAATILAKRAIERLVYRRADIVIVLSSAFREIAVRDYKVPTSRIRLANGIVDVERFNIGVTRAEACDRLGWPHDRRLLFTVRRLVARMGHDQLLSAMAEIVRVYPDALLYIAGRGRLERELAARAAALGLSRHVKFLGFLPEEQLPLAYRAAELTIVPSQALEGFGLTVAESLASGTPALVTPVGGLPEVVRGLSPDLVLASASAGAIAEGILSGLSGAIDLPNSVQCRDYAVRHFSTDRAAATVAAIYRELA